MSSNDAFFTSPKPAAVLKHAVFGAYANAFFSMVGSSHKGPMWLIDGYSGPGEYEADGSGASVKGSPIVALELAQQQRTFSSPRDVHCAFIEAKKSYFDALKQNVQPFMDRGLHVEIYYGSVAKHLQTVWAHVGENPVLTLIDPFGISAVSKMQMTDTLLAKNRSASSEILVNINVEAISRHGGYLHWGANGTPELKPTVTRAEGIELSDTFFGGKWWRQGFLVARDRIGDANHAAMEVVNQYRKKIEVETGASSLVVPIRRSPTGPMLFHFTLFYRHPAAAYKFADAAAKGTATWRKAFRQKDLEEALARDEERPGLFGRVDILEYSEKDAKAREDRLRADAVAHIEGNMRRLITPFTSGTGFQIGANIEELLGSYMSLAGESAIQKAWDNLAKASLVRARDKSKARQMWKLWIVKQ